MAESVILGGSAWPIGWSAGFIEAPVNAVREAERRWREELTAHYDTRYLQDASLDEQLAELAPLEAPYSRRLLMGTAGNWTAYFDNSLLGGDPGPWVGVLSEDLGCRGVVATHIPAEQYPYPATQLEVVGPNGGGPLRLERSISVGIFDEGRWTFEQQGPVQPFEDVEAYGTRRVRDRFSRDQLVLYLDRLGIAVDDVTFFRAGVLFADPRIEAQRVLDISAARSEYSSGPATRA